MIRIDDVIFNPDDLKLATLEPRSVNGKPQQLTIKLAISTGDGTVANAFITGDTDAKTRELFEELSKKITRYNLPVINDD